MRRNNLDICADLLRAAMGGAKKTHLVYQANLNFNIIKRYLTKLKESGLIEPFNGRFFTTDEGVRFINKYSELVTPSHR